MLFITCTINICIYTKPRLVKKYPSLKKKKKSLHSQSGEKDKLL